MSTVIQRALQQGLTLAETEVLGEPGRSSTSGAYLIGQWDGNLLGTASRPTSFELREAGRLRTRGETLLTHARDLEKLNSPREFVEGMRRASGDLVEGGSLLSRGEPVPGSESVQSVFEGQPELFDFALEVATGRCIVDTYDAVRLTFQAHSASDSQLRRALGQISIKLTSHATLYWEVFDWAKSQLSPARGRALLAAQKRCSSDLRATFCVPMSTSDFAAGLPTELVAHGLLDALELEWFGEKSAA